MNSRILFLILLFVTTSATLPAQDTSQQITTGRQNSPAQQQKPYVILISADGFRYDFARMYQATNLQRLSGSGVAADYMQPSFPSLTFPNHYSMVTGMYPAHHGLVDNDFYDASMGGYSMNKKQQVQDGRWYGGNPLWVLAEHQQMLTASYFWVASESNIQNTYPTYYYPYNEKRSIAERVQTVVNWLSLPAEKRPHLITFYFPQVDHEAHNHGPESPETAAAVHLVDSAVGSMVNAVAALGLPVNFIFVSDHGMTTVDTTHYLNFPPQFDTSRFNFYPGNALLQLYAKNKSDIAAAYRQLKTGADGYDVYLKDSLPPGFHYSTPDDRFNRIGDIVLIPQLPRVFNVAGKKVTPGKHGFDPALPDMRASFYAWGPAFKSGLQINGFENIHLYPLIANILGLSYNANAIDGRAEVLQPILTTTGNH